MNSAPLSLAISLFIFIFQKALLAHGLEKKNQRLRILSTRDGNLSAHSGRFGQELEAKTRQKEKLKTSGTQIKKRDVIFRMGLAANPDVFTQEPIKSRRSVGKTSKEDVEASPKLQSRSIHMGLAANPEVMTEDPKKSESKINKRTLKNHQRSFVMAKDLKAHGIPLRFNDQINSDVMIEDLPFKTENSSQGFSPQANTHESDKLPFHSIPDKSGSKNLSFGGDNESTFKNSQLNLLTVGKGKSITLSLRRTPTSEGSENLDPEIYFQQHLNHALKRHAQFSDKSIDERVLISNLRRRAESVGWRLNENPLQPRSLAERQNNKKDRNGFPLSAFLASRKGSVTPPSPLTAANSIGLSIEANDIGYFAQILVGTPPKEFTVIIDSGSADTWLGLEGCRKVENPSRRCGGKTMRFDSSTLKISNEKFQVVYGTGRVSGVLVEETLTMGGLTLTNHVFGGVTLASKEFTAEYVPFNGLLGTARSTLSNQGVLTPIEAMAKEGTLSGAFVGYALGRVSDSENIGQVTLGGIDQTKFSGKLFLFPNVNKRGFWEGQIREIQVNGRTILTDRTGILDTGTTLMILPPEDAIAIHRNIPGAVSDQNGGFRIPCTSRVKIGLSFGGGIFEINPIDLTFQAISQNLTAQCMSGIATGTVGGPRQWLIGDVFLKNVYFATDLTNNQMGLATVNKVEPKPN